MSIAFLKRMSPADLIAEIVAQVKDYTKLECVLNPDNEPSPFYAVRLSGTQPGKSKMMRLDVFEIEMHAISKPSNSQAEVLSMVQMLGEALEKNLCLPTPFNLVRQDDMGIQVIKQDQTGEWHAVVLYQFTVSYGLLIK